MGCGASAGTKVDARGDPPVQAKPLHNGHYETYRTATYVSNQHGIDVNSSHLIKADGYGEALPPPRPPDKSREELMRGNEDRMIQMDQHADSVPFAKAMEQSHQQFTQQTLISHYTVTKKRTVQFVEDGGENGEEIDTGESQVAPDVQVSQPSNPKGAATTGDSYDPSAAEMLLAKHKKDQELAKSKMDMDKMRHNITLQEKLSKRREIKRKQALAQGAATTVGGDVINDDAQLAAGEAGGIAASQEAEGAAVEGGTVPGFGAESAVAGTLAGAGVEAAQDKYQEVMAEQAPLPVAPETRKEVIYGNEDNIELFKDLEDFAINMEQISSPKVTFAILMESLLISQLSDLEKVRILFHWITAQNLNTINFPSNIDEDTPMGFLFAIKTDRKTYAELFCRLCSAAGLHAKVIRGYLKGVGYMPDYKFTGAADPFRGSWNAVLIDGQWRLIDTHWGARHVVEEDDVTSQAYETVYKYEEHYFLTNPDQLILTHFPDEKEWQLLANPVTIEQFQDMVKLWPLFYKSKLQLDSHNNGVIVAPQDGVVEVRIKMSEFSRRDTEMKGDFMTKQRQRNVGQFNLSRYTFHYVEGDYQVFKVHVPATGEYLLKLFGMSKKFSEENVYTNVALYQINCPKLKPAKLTPKNATDIQPSEIQAPFPEVNSPWGPPSSAEKVAPVSHHGPIITCDKEGEGTLIMQRLDGGSCRFMQQLCGADQKDQIPDRAVHFTTVSKQGSEVIVFRVRTPTAGNYCLTLYANSKDGDNNFNSFCNYFVVSRAQTKPAPPFPTVVNGALGPSEDTFASAGYSPVSSAPFLKQPDNQYLSGYGNAWIGPGEKNESTVSFLHDNPINIIAELQANSATSAPDLKQSVLVQDTGKRVDVVIHAPKYSPQSPEYLLRLYAASATQTAGIPVVFNAFIQAPMKEGPRLPQSPVRRWGPTSAFASLCDGGIRSTNSANLFASSTAGKDDTSCCRLYSGGDDLVFSIRMRTKLAIKSSLSLIESAGNFQPMDDGFTLVSSADDSTATLRVRIPTQGDYCLALYGSPISDQSGQMASLANILITASAPSSTTVQFPRSYGLWSASSAQLLHPFSKDLKRNAVNKIKFSIASVTETAAGLVTAAFPSVLLLTDKSAPSYPITVDQQTNTYEWDYLPGPGERTLSAVVQRDPNDTSLNYALQFDVVD